MARNDSIARSALSFAALALVLSVAVGCVSKVPIRVANSDKVGLSIGLAMPKISAEQDLVEFIVQESSKMNVIKESEVRAELDGLSPADEKRIINVYKNAVASNTRKEFGWPTPVVDHGCTRTDLQYCLKIYSQMSITWTGGVTSNAFGGNSGSWNVVVQTSGILKKTADQATVWRFMAQERDNISGSASKNEKRPFVKLYERLSKQGAENLLLNLGETIRERERVAASAPAG
jgi:hypothetical protein